MSAPDLTTIYDIETALEAAFKAVLSGIYNIPTFISIDGELLDTHTRLPIPRVDIQLELGSATGHFGDVQSGNPKLDAWNGTIHAEVITKRRRSTPGLHARARANTRLAIQYASKRFGADVLPWHVLTSIRDAGTQPAIEAGDDCDISGLSFEVVISVRTTAWPAAGGEDPDADFIFGDAAGNPLGDAAGNRFGGSTAGSTGFILGDAAGNPFGDAAGNQFGGGTAGSTGSIIGNAAGNPFGDAAGNQFGTAGATVPAS